MEVVNFEVLLGEMESIRNEIPLKAVINSRLRNHGEPFAEMSEKGLSSLRLNTQLPLQLIDFTRDLSAFETLRHELAN